MKPVTQSLASVSVNDLSLAQSVILVFPVQAIWISTIHWAAAKVSDLWPNTGIGGNIIQGTVSLISLSTENSSERLRYNVENLSEKWKKNYTK